MSAANAGERLRLYRGIDDKLAKLAGAPGQVLKKPCIAAAQCVANSGSVCEVIVNAANGCVAYAVDADAHSSVAGGAGPPERGSRRPCRVGQRAGRHRAVFAPGNRAPPAMGARGQFFGMTRSVSF